jgi:lipocalin
MHIFRAAVLLGHLCPFAIAAASPKPVEALNVTAFAGRWLQIWSSQNKTYGRFTVRYAAELGHDCVNVEYEAVPDVNVPNSVVLSVKTSVRVLGVLIAETGYATSNPDLAGEFEVKMGLPDHQLAHSAAFRWANFVVVALGPVVNSQYEYAVITDPARLSLYVLTRDAGRFRVKYESTVLEIVKPMGFNSFMNLPLKTNQDGCHYPNSKWLQGPLVTI